MSQTLCLHDEGEESWLLKLHLGCGGVFLHGYLNLDIEGKLAALNPEAKARNLTGVSDYYARLEGDHNHLPARRETIADWLTDVTRLPYESNSVDKIIAVQVFEHLTPIAAIRALQHWRDILKPDRPLVLSVPDMIGTLAMLATDYDFALRHLRGRQGNHYNSHHAWYTRDTFVELLEANRFRVEVLPNMHFYPAIVCRAVKE